MDAVYLVTTDLTSGFHVTIFVDPIFRFLPTISRNMIEMGGLRSNNRFWDDSGGVV